MGKVARRLTTKSAVAAILAIGVVPLAGQAYRAPRGPDGKPDLNGIWQALNEANYDIEAHMARPAMALRPGPYGPVPAAAVLALGAVGAVPPGLGVVEGGEIPYKPAALAIKKTESRGLVKPGSGDQVLSAGCATRHLHALPVPDPRKRPVRSHSSMNTAGAARNIN